MGYSCTARASFSDEALLAILQQAGNLDGTGNGWSIGDKRYFAERGREQADGSITATVWELFATPTGDRCRKCGSAKIAADGTVLRWPTATRSQRLAATASGAAKYIITYEKPLFQVV